MKNVQIFLGSLYQNCFDTDYLKNFERFSERVTKNSSIFQEEFFVKRGYVISPSRQIL